MTDEWIPDILPRGVYRREQLPHVVKDLRHGIEDYWKHFQHTRDFLRDWVPDEWSQIKTCRLNYDYQRLPGTQWYQPVPRSCHRLPWCIVCSKASTIRRTMRAFDAFSMCTPHGQGMQFQGIVQTAPLTREGQGWGLPASLDHGKFMRMVWKLLQEMYGEGLGCFMSFQAFGEEAMRKWHPHADLTLNGYRVLDGHATPLAPFQLAHGGRKRWDNAVHELARNTFGAEYVHQPRRPGRDLKMMRIKYGVAEYYGTMQYKVREMCDLRKIVYSAAERMVWWKSYKDSTRTPFTADGLLDDIEEYRRRYGSWSKHGAKRLHRQYGHMSKRLIKVTAATIGGAPLPHGRDCPCHQCNDWERVWLDDIERAVGQARPLGT